MAKQTAIDDMEQTPAPGAEGSSESTQEQSAEQPQAEQLVAETPEWVGELLASNQAVIESNAALIDAFDQFKELSKHTVGNYQPAGSHFEDKFDESDDYEVAAGKSFRDPNDFTKEYTEGDDVSHLGADVLKRLFAQGLIEAI